MGVAVGASLVWLALLGLYDVRERRLPNWLTLPGAVIIVAGAVTIERGTPAVVGGIALFAIYLVTHLLAPSSMGGGDVKLALGIGALTGSLGAEAWVVTALGAPMLTAIYGLLAFARRAESTVPHGPSMCATAAVVMLLTAKG